MAEPASVGGFVCPAGLAGSCPPLKQKSAELDEMRARFREVDPLLTSLDLQERLMDDASKAKKKKRKDPLVKALTDLGKKKDAEREHALLQQRTDFKEFFKQELAEHKTLVDGLYKEIDGLKAEIVGLKEENVGLKAEIAGLKKENVGLKAEIAGLKEENVGLKTRVTDLEKENVGLKTRVGELEERERRLSMRAVVSILNQLSHAIDTKVPFYWAAIFPDRYDTPCACLKLTQELTDSFAEIVDRGNSIAHDQVSLETLEKMLVSSSESDRMLIMTLMDYMKPLNVKFFQSITRPKERGDPPTVS